MLGTLSPVQIDHLIRGYFSSVGAFAVGGADMLMRGVSDEPTRPAADYFKMGTAGFAQELSSGSSRYVTQMYDEAQQLEQAYGTFRALVKEGKRTEAADFLQSHREEIGRYKLVEGVKQAESKYNEMVRAVERSSLSPQDKKDRIAAIQAMKDRAARVLAPR
jgi:hypothetical protein